ncbi:hypothetical protein B296_00000497 [Ensete ventricosum]|uniref:Uncharacterized protein n=1 Tax=Ensete ventricosum TaxID=4639 RepID=A0A427BA25_ENSVE|nr:hypothetical protein B296_00000497 [Ensete ventricosum]
MSVKLGTLRKQRRCNLVRQLEKGATKRDLQWWKPASMFLKRAWRNSTKAKEGSWVESLQEEVESQIDKVESIADGLTEDTKDFIQHLH